jgi:hypothetical protein
MVFQLMGWLAIVAWLLLLVAIVLKRSRRVLEELHGNIVAVQKITRVCRAAPRRPRENRMPRTTARRSRCNTPPGGV